MRAILAAAVLVLAAVTGAPAHAQGYADGVTVRRNADGSIETYDSENLPAAPAPPRKAARPGTRTIDGVRVRRNADGSIETFDAGSPGPAKPAGKRRPAASKPRSRPPARAGAQARSAGGVTVRRNADGSIETFDSD